MVNLTQYMIDKIKDFIDADDGLKANSIVVNEYYDLENEDLPCVAVEQIENSARNFSFTGEAITNITWQIAVFGTTTKFDETVKKPSETTNFISQKIANFIESNMKVERLSFTVPMPIDDDKKIYGAFLRYRCFHNIIMNKLHK